MSAHTVAWLFLYFCFAGLTLVRSTWGIPLYLMTFFANPLLWWWGGPLAGLGERWSLIAAIVFLGGVILDSRQSIRPLTGRQLLVIWILLAYSVNAAIVHFLFGSASSSLESFQALDLLWKQLGLFVLMMFSIKEPRDFWLLAHVMWIGGAFLALEVYFFHAGNYHHGRLENLPLPSGGSSNFFAPIFIQSLVIAGFLVFFGTFRSRAIALFCCVFLVEVVLQAMSRGTILAAAMGGGWMIVTSRGRIRTLAITALLAGVACVFAIMGPEQKARLFERFGTGLASEGERDVAASSRLVLWKATLDMVVDRPLGSGGNSFKSGLGQSYIPDEWKDTFHASQNGYLETASSWGVQGLLLFLLALAVGWRGVRQTTRQLRDNGDVKMAFLGACIEAILIIHLVASIFISGLRGEWFYWWMAMAFSFERIFYQPVEEMEPEVDEESGSMGSSLNTLRSV